jgi:type VI secretion system protein ImpJ
MDIYKKIFWHQGLFLQPQHFQLKDLSEHCRFGVLQHFGFKHFWGVGRMEINTSDLENHRFDLKSGGFYFNDGTHVDVPGNATSQARSFKDIWTEPDKPLLVYLGLHKWIPWGKNVSQAEGPDEAAKAATRFVALQTPEEIPDFHGDDPPAQIKCMAYAIKIFFETEKDRMSDYLVIPVARLVREGEKIVLSKNYIPPCLNTSTIPALDELLREIRDLSAARVRVLEQYKSPKAIQRSEMDLRYLVYLSAFMTLNRHVPVLEHHFTCATVHPFEVYGALSQFIGELSTFSNRINALGEGPDGKRILPPYDHENLWDCFSAARKLCGQLLEGIVLGPEYIIRLESQANGFSATVPDGVFRSDNAYWLILHSGEHLPAREAVNQQVKLSTAMSISNLVALAVPGVPLAPSDEPPPGMPRDTDAAYYRIDQTSPQWLEIERSQTVSFFWSGAPADLAVQIAVLRG